MRKLWCKFVGHCWDSDYNPVCERCGFDYRASCDYSGMIYLGWGQYGYIQQSDDARDRMDIADEVRRVNE